MFRLKWMVKLKDVKETVRRFCLRCRQTGSRLLPIKKTEM